MLLSWSAYLVSAVLWFWFGIQKHDKNLYLPCLGWMVLDSAVIIGVVYLWPSDVNTCP